MILFPRKLFEFLEAASANISHNHEKDGASQMPRYYLQRTREDVSSQWKVKVYDAAPAEPRGPAIEIPAEWKDFDITRDLPFEALPGSQFPATAIATVCEVGHVTYFLKKENWCKMIAIRDIVSWVPHVQGDIATNTWAWKIHDEVLFKKLALTVLGHEPTKMSSFNRQRGTNWKMRPVKGQANTWYNINFQKGDRKMVDRYGERGTSQAGEPLPPLQQQDQDEFGGDELGPVMVDDMVLVDVGLETPNAEKNVTGKPSDDDDMKTMDEMCMNEIEQMSIISELFEAIGNEDPQNPPQNPPFAAPGPLDEHDPGDIYPMEVEVHNTSSLQQKIENLQKENCLLKEKMKDLEKAVKENCLLKEKMKNLEKAVANISAMLTTQPSKASMASEATAAMLDEITRKSWEGAYIDNGIPSESLPHDIQRCLQLIKEERHLVAERLRQSIMMRANEQGSDQSEHTRQLVEKYKEEFKDLKHRAQVLKEAKENLNTDGWACGKSNSDYDSFYRKESNGTVTIKLVSHREDAPLFELLAVLREYDLFVAWAPFCSSSRRLKQIGNFDAVGWFSSGCYPACKGYSRDACFRAIGCDSMFEDQSIFLAAEWLDDEVKENNIPSDYDGTSYMRSDPTLKNIDIPPRPKSSKSGRMKIRKFQMEINVHSLHSTTTRIIANIDPDTKSRLPQKIINYCTKRVCKNLLKRLQEQAIKVMHDPVDSAHAQRIREDPFYREWLLPKFHTYCNKIGWGLPSVEALKVECDDEE